MRLGVLLDYLIGYPILAGEACDRFLKFQLRLSVKWVQKIGFLLYWFDWKFNFLDLLVESGHEPWARLDCHSSPLKLFAC